jgi:hypothetical protein
MKLNILVFLFVSSVFAGQGLAQDLKNFFQPIFPIEQELQGLSGGKPNILTVDQFRVAFKRGGVFVDNLTAQRLKEGVVVLEDALSKIGGPITSVSSLQAFFTSKGLPINFTEAQAIFDHATGGNAPGINAHVFLLSLISKKGFAKFIVTLEEEVKDGQRPSRPDSPASRSIRRVVSRGLVLQQIILPKTSGDGEDWFDNAYTAFNTSYSSYEDLSLNGSGKEKSVSLTVGGDIGGDTSLSFSLSSQRNHLGGENQSTSKTFGGDLLVHHKLDEHFGFGAYAFYQRTRIDDFDDRIFGHGFGLLFSATYDFGYVDVSTVQTLNKVWYKFGEDNLYVGSFRVNRNVTDWFSCALVATYTDSLRSDQSGDNSYWGLGGDMTFSLSEQASFTIAYEKTTSLVDFKANTFNGTFVWTF